MNGGWGSIIGLESGLATILGIFLLLMQFHPAIKGKISERIAYVFGSAILALFILIPVFHSKVSAWMGDDHEPTFVVAPPATITLPTIVRVYGETRPSSHDAGNGSIQPEPNPPLIPPANPLSMLIPATKPWTPTNVLLRAGQFVTIEARGEIIVSDHTPPQTPNGTGKACYPDPGIHYWHFPAQNLSCSSLIGRIGDLTPFEVGSSKQFRAESSGPLWLGVNDNWFPDNSGNWEVTIFVKDDKSQ
jgi:hypothetical protein